MQYSDNPKIGKARKGNEVSNILSMAHFAQALLKEGRSELARRVHKRARQLLRAHKVGRIMKAVRI
jgi:hypothetical protein